MKWGFFAAVILLGIALLIKGPRPSLVSPTQSKISTQLRMAPTPTTLGLQTTNQAPIQAYATPAPQQALTLSTVPETESACLDLALYRCFQNQTKSATQLCLRSTPAGVDGCLPILATPPDPADDQTLEGSTSEPPSNEALAPFQCSGSFAQGPVEETGATALEAFEKIFTKCIAGIPGGLPGKFKFKVR